MWKTTKALSNYNLYNKAKGSDSQSSESKGEEESYFLNLCKMQEEK